VVTPDGRSLIVAETHAGHSVACALGGENRRTLYMLFFQMSRPFDLGRAIDPRQDEHSPLRGWIEAIEVPVAGSGWP
jgi:hypothetical protein